jgi:hypothetical protein
MSRPQQRGVARTVVFGGLFVAAVLLIGSVIAGSLFDLGVPFSQSDKDHSPPLILNEIRDLSEFRASEAEFEVIIDKETDVRWVPSFVAGERVQFVAVGSVDATIDFSEMGEDSVIFDEDSNTATIILATPQIGEARIDLDNSGVMNRDRGVLDRIGGLFVDNPTAEIELVREAEDKIEAAAVDTDLVLQAQQNTTEMLTNLLEALGVDNVRVVYEAPDAALG